MISKFSFAILFLVSIICGSLWFIKTDVGDADTLNVLSSKDKSIVSRPEIKNPNQKNKLSIENNKYKAKKIDRVSTSDELYKQQLPSGQTDFELEPTKLEIEVMPEELKILEQDSAVNSSTSFDTPDIGTLPDNPDQTNRILLEDELPPSEDYKEIVPFELEQSEDGFDKTINN